MLNITATDRFADIDSELLAKAIIRVEDYRLFNLMYN
jgi:hypothetical protein